MQLISDSQREQLPPDVREVLRALPDLALFRVTAHASGAFPAWVSYGAALLTELELPPSLREIAILRLAHLERCEYEFSQHAAIAATVGVADDQIDTLRRGSTVDLDAKAQLVVDAVSEFVRDARVSAPTLGRLRTTLGERETTELLLVLGHYLAIARLIASAQLAPDEPNHIAITDAR